MSTDFEIQYVKMTSKAQSENSCGSVIGYNPVAEGLMQENRLPNNYKSIFLTYN